MRQVKTAKGKILDMGTLAAQNEETRAISNMPINARGDIIDNRGNVKVAREKVSKEFYKNNVPGSDEKLESIKEDVTIKPVTKKEEPKEEAPKPTPTPVAKPKPAPVVAEETDNIEVSRVERERPNGSKYYEVEYMDGSMEEIDIPSDNQSKK